MSYFIDPCSVILFPIPLRWGQSGALATEQNSTPELGGESMSVLKDVHVHVCVNLRPPAEGQIRWLPETNPCWTRFNLALEVTYLALGRNPDPLAPALISGSKYYLPGWIMGLMGQRLILMTVMVGAAAAVVAVGVVIIAVILLKPWVDINSITCYHVIKTVVWV